jgi:curved DNA-binding protein CbpA
MEATVAAAPAEEALETQTVAIRGLERPVAETAAPAEAAAGSEAAGSPGQYPTVESPAAATPTPTGAAAEEPTVEVEAFQAAPPTDPMVSAPVDTAVLERRREVLEVFQSLPLKNHFEVLGVEPGCDDDEVKRAYVALTKRFHPDAQRDKRLEDMHDILEAIFIRVQEAWEVLGEAKSRASYEASSGIVRRPRTARPSGERAPSVPGIAPSPPPARPAPPPEYVPPEEVLYQVRQLLAQARYWDAIQILESTLPGMEPRTQQHRGRLLLARAYSKNPNWLRRAEETLQQLVREDPTNADAHFELGMIYKTSGFPTRAQAMFRRTLELRPGHKEASAELGIPTDTGTPRPGLLKRLFKRGG